MADVTFPTNETPVTELAPLTEKSVEQVPTPEESTLEEEIEEELIIEDFTIDGICGVY